MRELVANFLGVVMLNIELSSIISLQNIMRSVWITRGGLHSRLQMTINLCHVQRIGSSWGEIIA
jgi:hypothetical protein